MELLFKLVLYIDLGGYEYLKFFLGLVFNIGLVFVKLKWSWVVLGLNMYI